MSICRSQTQTLIHLLFREKTQDANLSDNSRLQGYIQKFSLHHIMHLEGIEGVFEVCLSTEYMARYIETWETIVQPLKILRLIGMNKYLSELRKTIVNTQWSHTSAESLLDILYLILMWEEVIDEMVLLSEEWNLIFLTLEMPFTLQIRHHQILGLQYRKINQFEKGKEHLARSIELGKKHGLSMTLDSISTRNEMAILLHRIGKIEEGFSLMKSVHNDAKTHLGPEEELTIISQRSLAWFAFSTCGSTSSIS